MKLFVYSDGYLKAGDNVYRAVYGKNGIGPKFAEGDGISPEGTWPLRRVFYRPDRIEKPFTKLDIQAMTPNDAWCDVKGDPKYNQFVRLPYPVIDEHLWRQNDNLYDLVIVIGYNDNPVVDGAGSAIFFHIARPDYAPSSGCASVCLSDMLEILPQLTLNSTLTFTSTTLKNESVKWPYNPPRLA